MDFAGKTALVTGGARGIGHAIASGLGKHGAAIAVVDLDLDSATAGAESLGAQGIAAKPFACNVADFEAVKSLGEAVASEFDTIDILVNNAGIARDRLLLRMTPDDWAAVLNVNLTGAFNACKVFGPPMLKRREGSVINIASVVGQMGNVGQANYSASKAGLIGLTKSLAKEFAARSVRVNAIAPGFIRTAMTDELPDEVKQQMQSTIPMVRFGEPEDVANIAVFLASDLASYVTGQVINCDGGMIMAR